MRIRIIDAIQLRIGCGGTLNSAEGEISSPGYPVTYGNNAECFWRIDVSQGSKVLFAFSDLDINRSDCRFGVDYVEVNSVKSRYSYPIIKI